MNISRPGLDRLCSRVGDIVSSVGTPFFCYDWPSLVDAAGLLESACARELTNVRRFYLALFALPNIRLIARLSGVSGDLGVSCNTPEEILALRKWGWNDWDRVVFSGGVLPPKDLELVAGCGCLVHAASAGNFERLVKGNDAPRLGARLDLNCNALKGLTLPELRNGVALANQAGRRVVGLHAYLGTAVESIDLHIRHAENLISIACDYPEIEEINFGGGFSYDYADPVGNVSRMIDFPGYFRAVNRLLAERLGKRKVRVAWEPGRVVFAGAGFFVTEVIEVRVRDNAVNAADVYVDASFAQLAGPKIRNRQHLVLAVGPDGRLKQGLEYEARLCGATTLSTDVLMPKPCPLPRVEPGDFLVILDVGAYGRAGSYNFLGKAHPPEVLLDEAGWTLIRDRQRADHLLEGLPNAE